MSMAICAGCNRFIDTDDDPASCVDNGFYCEPCRDRLEAELEPDPDKLERELAGMGET